MATVISIVSYPFLPARVGGQKGVALFSKYFSRYHRLICVTSRKNDPAAAEGYEVLNILSDSPIRYINPRYFFTLKRLIRERKATHLILEHPYYGWLGILLKWFTGVRLVVHSHNIESIRWRGLGKWWWRILWLYERFTHRRADYNFFIHQQDMAYALEQFGLEAGKCMVMTYGIEREQIPSPQEKAAAADTLRQAHSIDSGDCLLLFNGAFDYPPNIEALENILRYINPFLRQKQNFSYRIIICGRNIPASLQAVADERIIFAGFVDNIDLYFTGADVFLNPVHSGGGIKTKLVEALGANLNAVSTPAGAVGIDPDICNGKLLIAKKDDWQDFAERVVLAAGIRADMPPAYFGHFYWGHSTKAAADFINERK